MTKQITEEVVIALKVIKDFCTSGGWCEECPFSRDGINCRLKTTPSGYPDLERKIIYELPDDGNL